MRIRYIICILFAFFLCLLDLNSQVLTPVPQEMSVDGRKTTDLSRGVVLQDVKGRFSDDFPFLKLGTKGVRLTVDYGGKAASQAGVKAVSGAYVLDITSKGISIIGYDEQGVYYAIQTLRQLVESSAVKGKVARCTVSDWPEVQVRGVLEGPGGKNWQQKTRLSIIGFCGDLKLNTYIYAPSDDPYCGAEDWTMPYPPARAAEIKELISACRNNHLNFVWAVRPGKEVKWSEEEYSRLIGKFEMMYYLGVRAFAIIFDTESQDSRLSDRQIEVADRATGDFISKRKGVSDLVIMSDIGKSQDYTVCSLSRPDDSRLCIMTQGMSQAESCTQPYSIFSAHMAHGEASKLNIFALADYSWNFSSYDVVGSWERAIAMIAPEVAAPYRMFSAHYSDSEAAYARKESMMTETFAIDDFSQEKYDALVSEFIRMETVQEEMESCHNKELLSELRPWLIEFSRLGTRCRKTLECLSLYHKGDISGFWAAYADNLMSDMERNDYLAHPSGTVRLQPFYENMMTELASAFNEKYKGRLSYSHVHDNGIDVYTAPQDAERCYLILNNPSGNEVVVRLSDASGRYVAEFCIDTSYFEFDLKSDARTVEVIGADEIYEMIFVR